MKELIASGLGGVTSEQKVGLEQLEDDLSNTLGAIGVELQERRPNGPRGEKEANELQHDGVRCIRLPGEVVDDSQIAFFPPCVLTASASEREAPVLRHSRAIRCESDPVF